MEPLNKAHISNYVVLLTEKGPSIATSVISPSDQVELGLDKLGEDADARVEIFWNSNINPFGVVTGGSQGDNEIIIKRLVASHLQAWDAQVLMQSPYLQPCSRSGFLLHICTRIRSAGLSIVFDSSPAPEPAHSSHRPRNPSEVLEVYSEGGLNPQLLTFRESDIRIQHLLALLTASPDAPPSSRILNAIRHITGRLTFPFDLQRFNELVEDERWDEEGQNYAASRQTLLGLLVDEPGSDLTQKKRELLVDLTDPWLSELALDSVLFTMLISKFIKSSPFRRKLIVLNNAHEYLRPQSILENTLQHVAAKGLSRDVSILVSTSQPQLLSEAICNSVDYAICSTSASGSWLRWFKEHIQENCTSHDLFPSNICLASKRKGMYTPEGIFRNDLSTLYLPLSTLRQSTPPPRLRLNVKVQQSKRPTNTIAPPLDDFLSSPAFSEPPAVQSSPPYKGLSFELSLEAARWREIPRLPPTSTANDENIRSAVRPTADEYPPELRPLIVAIIKLTDGIPDLRVSLESVRAHAYGKNGETQTRPIGSSAFIRLLSSARSQGFTDQGGSGATKWISLKKLDRPLPGSTNIPGQVKSNYSDLTSVMKNRLRASDFPVEHRPLISAILRLTSGRANEVVRAADVVETLRRFESMPDLTEDGMLIMLLQASKSNLVRHYMGSDGLYMMLEEKKTVDSNN
ncbi:hypothetical protein PIIN_07991 [Serendipita indica DSM 11827]|uniref:Uncharacterized protein n=1 Tax=Serendipita indica (strain DSM 11827) TaxID=1109443 RepID=G4TRU4_SERID|nr:hypothetical protein PIIN_07991 [Serendipita indica DSM 11827]